MNARAIQLLGQARPLLATLPGAASIQCNDLSYVRSNVVVSSRKTRLLARHLLAQNHSGPPTA